MTASVPTKRTLRKCPERAVAGDSEAGRHQPGKPDRQVGDLFPAFHGGIPHRLVHQECVVMAHEGCGGKSGGAR